MDEAPNPGAPANSDESRAGRRHILRLTVMDNWNINMVHQTRGPAVAGLGRQASSIYAWPLKSWEWTHAPGSQKEFKRLGYGAKPDKNGNVLGISLPETVKTVRLQIEGTLSGSSYSGGITSNVVEVKIPQ